MDASSETPVMHGEYKVRGGKLVAVDVTAQDGRIATAHVFGDFFLDTVVDPITGKVEQPVPTPSYASDPTWSPLLSGK